jgi:hypothetical protein
VNRLSRILVIALSATLALSASPALAKKKGKHKKGLGPVVARTAVGNPVSSGGAVTTATATCPGKRKAVGGGFTAQPGGFSAILFVSASLRSGAGGWTASASYVDIDPGANPALSVTAIVYCRRVQKPITDVSSSAPVPATAHGTAPAAATCAGQRKLIGGGFSISPASLDTNNYVLAYGDSAVNSAWTAVAENGSTPVARTVVSHAYCAKGVKAPTLVTGTSTATVPGLGSSSATAAPCPKKKLLSGGGFSSPPDASAETAYQSSQISGGSWTVAAITGATRVMTLNSQGICL